jgi:hypothetical protein
MAVVCADCRTENRDGAKFCRGCGHRLVTIAPVGATPPANDDWPETQRIPLPPPVAPPGLFAAVALKRPKASDPIEKAFVPPSAKRQLPPLPSYPAPSAASRPPPSAPKRPSSHARKAPARRSNALWISVIAFFVIAAALASAGGWYIARKQAAETPLPAAQEPVATTPVDATPPVPLAQTPEPAAPPSVAASPAPAISPAPIAEATPPVAPAKPAVAAPPKVRKPAVVPTPAPLPTPSVADVPPPASTPAPVPAPAAPASPQTACAGLNFFARSQCMATQCAKADYKAHPQCDAVRRQQQIDEEKRNPSMAN